MHLPTTLQNLNFVSGNTLHTRNLEKSPSKKQNITLDRNYSNAIGSSKWFNGTSDPPQDLKVANILFTTELFQIILRDIRLWAQLMRLEFVFIKYDNWT